MFKRFGLILVGLVIGAGAIFALGSQQGISAGDVRQLNIPSMVSHKALYGFKMVSMESGSGVVGLEGKMYYEQQDVCEAWTTDHRFTTEYFYPDRNSVLNTSHYVAWEAKDQSRFSFNSERRENGELIEQLRGEALRQKGGVTRAEYSRPEDMHFDLPEGYLLPTMHTAEIIRHAGAGEKFFHAVMFDGTDSDGPVDVNVFIGKPAGAEEIAIIAGRHKEIAVGLLSPQAWHIRMAVFPLAEREQMVPSYEMDMLLHDNGVISHALVDYKSFKVEQTLTSLESLPEQPCVKEKD